MNRAERCGSSGAMVAPCHLALATSHPPRTGTTPASTWYGSCAPWVGRMLISSPAHARAAPLVHVLRSPASVVGAGDGPLGDDHRLPARRGGRGAACVLSCGGQVAEADHCLHE